MDNNSKKWFLLIIFVVIGIGGYFVIKKAFPIWEVSTAITYFGTFLGAIATIIAVMMTIKQSKEQSEEMYKEQRRLLSLEFRKEQIISLFEKKRQNVDEIKKVICMDYLDNMGLIDLLTNKSIYTTYERLAIYLEQSSEALSTPNLDKAPKTFWETVSDQIKEIGVVFLKYSKLDEEYNKKKNKKDSCKDMKISIPLTKPSDEEPSESLEKPSLYALLREQRKHIKPRFTKAYNDYISYMQDKKEEEIELLYNN